MERDFFSPKTDFRCASCGATWWVDGEDTRCPKPSDWWYEELGEEPPQWPEDASRCHCGGQGEPWEPVRLRPVQVAAGGALPEVSERRQAVWQARRAQRFRKLLV